MSYYEETRSKFLYFVFPFGILVSFTLCPKELCLGRGLFDFIEMHYTARCSVKQMSVMTQRLLNK